MVLVGNRRHNGAVHTKVCSMIERSVALCADLILSKVSVVFVCHGPTGTNFRIYAECCFSRADRRDAGGHRNQSQLPQRDLLSCPGCGRGGADTTAFCGRSCLATSIPSAYRVHGSAIASGSVC